MIESLSEHRCQVKKRQNDPSNEERERRREEREVRGRMRSSRSLYTRETMKEEAIMVKRMYFGPSQSLVQTNRSGIGALLKGFCGCCQDDPHKVTGNNRNGGVLSITFWVKSGLGASSRQPTHPKTQFLPNKHQEPRSTS